MKAIKEQLKKEAKEITAKKAEIKTLMQEGKYAGTEQWNLESFRHQWRHKFLAYCLLRGRTLDEIENTVREGNEPNQKLIDKYTEEFTGGRDV